MHQLYSALARCSGQAALALDPGLATTPYESKREAAALGLQLTTSMPRCRVTTDHCLALFFESENRAAAQTPGFPRRLQCNKSPTPWQYLRNARSVAEVLCHPEVQAFHAEADLPQLVNIPGCARG